MSFLFTIGGTIFSVEFRAVSNVCHISDRILCRAKGRCCCVCFHFFSCISLLALMFLLFRVEETKGKKENTLFASGKKKKNQGISSDLVEFGPRVPHRRTLHKAFANYSEHEKQHRIRALATAGPSKYATSKCPHEQVNDAKKPL